jgi:hypothetical protein
MSDASGQGIDVDLVADSEIGDLWESFDAWRVRSFLNTAAAAEPSDVDVNDACGYLVEAGELVNAARKLTPFGRAGSRTRGQFSGGADRTQRDSARAVVRHHGQRRRAADAA